MFARIMGLALLAGCGLAMVGERGTGADEKPPLRKLVIGVDKWIALEITKKKDITKIVSSEPDIIDLRGGGGGGGKNPQYYRYPAKDEPGVIYIITVTTLPEPTTRYRVSVGGLKPGKTLMTLTDQDGKSEAFQVEVRRELALPVGISYTMPSPTTKPIDKVAVENIKFIKASRDAKGEAVQIESLAVGETTLRVTDTDGKTEPILIQVRKPTFVLTEGEQKKMQLMDKQRLEVIANDNDRVLKVQPAKDDPTTVVIDAIGPGISNLVLVDLDRRQKAFEVGVKPKGK